MEVKILNNGDNIESFMSVARKWFDEANKAAFGLNIDMDAVIFDLARLISLPDCGVLVLIDNEKVVGFYGVSISQSKFSKQRIAEERYYYVVPEKRGISSLRLLKAAESWAKNKGCSHFIIYASQVASDLHDRTCKLYEKLNMKQFETSYIKEL